MKLLDKLDTRSLRDIIKIETPLLETIQRIFLIYVCRDNHIICRRYPRKSSFENYDMKS